jgi:tetratricopeptide (TPR) repeat protein
MKGNRLSVILILVTCLLFFGCATGSKKYADDFFNEGAMWYQKGEYDRAVDEFSKALEMSPSGEREIYVIYYNRGLAYYKNRDYDKAIEDFTKSIQLTPGERSKRKPVAELYDTWMEVKPPSPKIKYELFNVHKARGDAYYYKEAYKKAIDDYSLALQYGEQRKELPSVYESLGWAWFQKGDFDKAIDEFTTALAFNPRLAQCYFGRARAWAEKGNPEAALKDARKALKLRPDSRKYDDLVFELKSRQKN